MKALLDLYKLEQMTQRAKIQGDYQQSLQLYDQIIALKQNLPNRLGLAKSMADKAFLLEQMGYPRDALQVYSSTAQLIHKSPNRQFKEIIDQRINHLSQF